MFSDVTIESNQTVHAYLHLTSGTNSDLDFDMAEQRKAVIKNADMSEPMQQDAVDIASLALSKYNIEKVGYGCATENFSSCAMIAFSHGCFLAFPQDVAAYIKKEFDKKFNPTWYVWFTSSY